MKESRQQCEEEGKSDQGEELQPVGNGQSEAPDQKRKESESAKLPPPAYWNIAPKTSGNQKTSPSVRGGMLGTRGATSLEG